MKRQSPSTAAMVRRVKEFLKGRSDASQLSYDKIMTETKATRYAVTKAKRDMGLLASQLKIKKEAQANGKLPDDRMKELRKVALYQRRNYTSAEKTAHIVAEQYGLTHSGEIKKLTSYIQTQYSPHDKIGMSTMALRVPFSEFGKLVSIGEEKLLLGGTA